MTKDERLLIELECTRLVNLYANLNDAGKWDEIAALYTEDGQYGRPTAPDDPVIGRQAILESLFGRPPRTSRHVVSNIVVDVKSETEASGFSVILLFVGVDDPDGGLPKKKEGMPLVGTFEDIFVKVGDTWKFKSRRGGLTFSPK